MKPASASSSIYPLYPNRDPENVSLLAPKSKTKAQPKKKKNTNNSKLPLETICSEEQMKRTNRRNRFGGEIPGKALSLNLARENVGTSRALEKQYFRITGIVDFSQVRPRKVLEQSLKECLLKYSVSQSWSYLQGQFKSIRQDLTVQGIRDDFAIKVYETNAKMALENLDFSQFNQCQGQLEEHYRLNQVSVEQSDRSSFLSYRIIYLTLQNLHMDLLRLIGELTKKEMAHEKVARALKIRKAYVEGNFCRVFKLKNCTDEHCQLLMKFFIPKLRMLYLLTIAKGHFFINLTSLEKLLEFSNSNECKNFLLKEGAVISEEKLDCRKSLVKFGESALLLSSNIRAMLALGASPIESS